MSFAVFWLEASKEMHKLLDSSMRNNKINASIFLSIFIQRTTSPCSPIKNWSTCKTQPQKPHPLDPNIRFYRQFHVSKSSLGLSWVWLTLWRVTVECLFPSMKCQSMPLHWTKLNCHRFCTPLSVIQSEWHLLLVIHPPMESLDEFRATSEAVHHVKRCKQLPIKRKAWIVRRYPTAWSKMKRENPRGTW